MTDKKNTAATAPVVTTASTSNYAHLKGKRGPNDGPMPTPDYVELPLAKEPEPVPKGKRVPNEYTPTQRRIIALLSDGELHTPEEIREFCMPDVMVEIREVSSQIGTLRQKLHKKGVDIVCVFTRRDGRYRMVRLLADPYNE